jgi:hypothetical protein
MKRIHPRTPNASWKIIPISVIAAALTMGGCGGDSGGNTSVAPVVAQGAQESGLPATESTLHAPVRSYGAEVPWATICP